MYFVCRWRSFARVANWRPIGHIAGKTCSTCFFRQAFDRIRRVHDHGDPVIGDDVSLKFTPLAFAAETFFRLVGRLAISDLPPCHR